ncbi:MULTISPECIES: PulJ/GspJ family protein [unclassified Nocardioides]|uniref:PulJ/GspJ family protein n=1 Tax=unclassified Nocardioides TaxID=2615069 RepID=UPI00361CB6D0
MIARLRRRASDDAGFTLVEMVMTVAIVGFISVALTGVVFSFMRNTVETQARMTESHDVQFAAAYWQRDVASTGVRSTTYDPTSRTFELGQSVDAVPACGLPAGATAVVTLAWNEYTSLVSTDAPTVVKVTYASRAAGGGYELLRVRCVTNPSTVSVADSLTAPPTLTCDDASGANTPCAGDGAPNPVPSIVNLRLSVLDAGGHNTTPYEVTLAGERRQS